MIAFNDIAALRLNSQQISGTNLQTAKDLVSRMGAMQAQDFNMAKWAIGTRLSGVTDKEVEESFNRGDILRMHLLRPTWHFVAAEDIRWMLELTAPHIGASMRSRRKELGITDQLIRRSNKVIETALSLGDHLTRDEIIVFLKKAGINMSSPVTYYHLLLYAQLEGIICSGNLKGKNHTYALLDQRAPKKAVFNKGEALAELGKRYFTSHGPATLRDFAWWSGLPVSDVKKSIESLKGDIINEKIGLQDYWYSTSISFINKEQDFLHLLPAYDEFIIGYKDRSPSLAAVEMSKAISNNGIFRPVILINGRVAGTWKRSSKNSRFFLEPYFFSPPDENQRQWLETAVGFYGSFLNREIEVAWP